MPEIGEVARTVHFLRKNLLNRTLTKVVATQDEIVYGKVGTSAAEIEKHLTNNTVVDVGQKGKYFWMVMAKPPHPVMHFGMSGWFKFSHEHTFYYRAKEDSDRPPKKGKKTAKAAGGSSNNSDEEGNNGEQAKQEEEWPPKYWKFHVEAALQPSSTKGKKSDQKTDIITKGAFVDARRLARIRLVDCPGKDLPTTSPLKELGPDPVQNKDIFTLDWLGSLVRRKKVPIKALLLDQSNIAGIGNWVGDEVLYDAKIHPEQYANTLQDTQIASLHKSIQYVCGTAVDLLAETTEFPDHWIFKHRWSKGKKNAVHEMPNGNSIVFLTVGGRTSAVVPAEQKKTGPVAKDVDDDAVDEVKREPPKSATKAKKRNVEESDDDDDDDTSNDNGEKDQKESNPRAKKPARTKATQETKTSTNGVKAGQSKKSVVTKKQKMETVQAEDKDQDQNNMPRRRSTRTRK